MLKRVILLAVFAGAACSQDISRDLPYISVDIRTPPIAPPTAGGYLLQYELYVTDWYDKDITIRAVDMMVGDVLPSHLKKSRRSIVTYLEELRKHQICSIEAARNQHIAGHIEVCDAFWPYGISTSLSSGFARKAQASPEPGRQCC